MPANQTPNSSTGPTTDAINDLAALRKRLESLENLVARLLAQRTPAPIAMAGLSNAKPMRNVTDGDAPVYDKATGQYKPGNAGGYKSLTGAGKTTSPGSLTQDGELDVHGDFFVLPSGDSSTSLNIEPASFVFFTNSGTAGGFQVNMNNDDSFWELDAGEGTLSSLNDITIVAARNLNMGGNNSVNIGGGAEGIQIGDTSTGSVDVGFMASTAIGFYGHGGVVQHGGISDPSGGTTVDNEARTAITDLLDLFRSNGMIA